jgi:putative YphP/YqiW family bacilliredoxin
MSMSFESYMKDMVQPMREELTRIGIKELKTPEEVAENLESSKGTALLVIN